MKIFQNIEKNALIMSKKEQLRIQGEQYFKKIEIEMSLLSNKKSEFPTKNCIPHQLL